MNDFWSIHSTPTSGDRITALDEKPVDEQFERVADELLSTERQPMDLDEVTEYQEMRLRDIVEKSAEFRLRSKDEVGHREFDAFGLFVLVRRIMKDHGAVLEVGNLSPTVLDTRVQWDDPDRLSHGVLVTRLRNGWLRIWYDGRIFADCSDLNMAVEMFKRMATEKTVPAEDGKAPGMRRAIRKLGCDASAYTMLSIYDFDNPDNLDLGNDPGAFRWRYEVYQNGHLMVGGAHSGDECDCYWISSTSFGFTFYMSAGDVIQIIRRG